MLKCVFHTYSHAKGEWDGKYSLWYSKITGENKEKEC